MQTRVQGWRHSAADRINAANGWHQRNRVAMHDRFAKFSAPLCRAFSSEAVHRSTFWFIMRGVCTTRWYIIHRYRGGIVSPQYRQRGRAKKEVRHCWNYGSFGSEKFNEFQRRPDIGCRRNLKASSGTPARVARRARMGSPRRRLRMPMAVAALSTARLCCAGVSPPGLMGPVRMVRVHE